MREGSLSLSPLPAFHHPIETIAFSFRRKRKLSLLPIGPTEPNEEENQRRRNHSNGSLSSRSPYWSLQSGQLLYVRKYRNTGQGRREGRGNIGSLDYAVPNVRHALWWEIHFALTAGENSEPSATVTKATRALARQVLCPRSNCQDWRHEITTNSAQKHNPKLFLVAVHLPQFCRLPELIFPKLVLP